MIPIGRGLMEHFVAYLGLSLVLTLGYGRRLTAAGLVLALTAAAALFEIAQNWVPDRAPSIVDFLVSASGALIGIWLADLVRSARGSTRR